MVTPYDVMQALRDGKKSERYLGEVLEAHPYDLSGVLRRCREQGWVIYADAPPIEDVSMQDKWYALTARGGQALAEREGRERGA